MKIVKSVIAAALFAAASTGASAQTVVFHTDAGHVTSSTGSGAGNSYTFTSATGGIHAIVSGFQSRQSNGATNSAYVGVYAPGLGVIGNSDGEGSNGRHQIDNVGGYTDFVQLIFDRAVTLNSIGLTSYALGSNTLDNDLSYIARTGLFTAGSGTPTGWTTVLGAGGRVPSGDTGLQALATTGSSAVSRFWLVGASLGSTNDEFKISSLTVTAAVPEPATWGMMLIGFGAIGMASRSRRRKLVHATA
jgi:PEP-CTERM motif